MAKLRGPVTNTALAALVSAAALALGACGKGEQAVVDGSTDATAEEWAAAEVESPAGADSAQTHFAKGPNGLLLMSWLEPDGEEFALKYSRFGAGVWGAPQEIARGANWFVNWADFPSVVPITAEIWIAHWLVLKPDQIYAYDIAYALSHDGGRSWSTQQILNADETIAEHGFATFFPWGDDIGAIWLDGRILGAMTIDEIFAAEEAVGISLRYARLSTGGAVVERGQIDELVCDCCQTDAAITPDGPLIVYRDRSQAEQRDITVRRHDGNGWTQAITLGNDNWIIDGCPVNGPSIDVSDTTVAVAWFTAPENLASVQFSLSQDGGYTFADALTLDESGSFGHTDVEIAGTGDVFVSWWRRADEDGMDLVVRKIANGRELGETRVLAHSDFSAPIDVPQMSLVGDRLVLAWTEFGDAAGIYSVSAPVW